MKCVYCTFLAHYVEPDWPAAAQQSLSPANLGNNFSNPIIIRLRWGCYTCQSLRAWSLWPIPWHAIIKMNQNFPMMSLMRNKILSFLNYWHKNGLTKYLYLLTCLNVVTISYYIHWGSEISEVLHKSIFLVKITVKNCSL